MINFDVLENEVKKGIIDNSYIFCGLDEELIKEGIQGIVDRVVDKDFQDLNYIRLDGMTISFEDIVNACETMPFMGEKKAVVVYRASFLKEKTDSANTKIYTEIAKYIKDMPPYTTLIMYYILNDKRENPKKNRKLISLEKIAKIVHFDKLKRDRYEKKIEEIFKSRGKAIGKVEMKYFAEKVQNNFDIIKREIDKLIAYTNGREIRKSDIDKLVPNTSEDDIFDLIEFISQRKVEKAIDLMDELLFKADQHMLIITNIENTFKRLYEIKLLLGRGKRIDYFVTKYKLPTFVCEKLIKQSHIFSVTQLQELMKLSLETEEKLKSSGVDKKMEMELMLFKAFMIN